MNRQFCNGTLLPAGQVALTGGVSLKYGDFVYSETQGVKYIEIYTPGFLGQKDAWANHASESETRGYRSIALLMPDGRIWTTGSENEDDRYPPYNAGAPKLAIELYEPAYYSVPARIRITTAPKTIRYAQVFNISFSASSPPAAVIGCVAFMRFGSATHSFDGDQRYMSVPIEQVKGGQVVRVRAPPDGTVAPRGYYMLWLLDGNGVPCEKAAIARLGS